ncbi:MAG TPA: HD domain-containing phosphohydrolase [Gemmataceae bacterium]|jgi:HD-GYP domain-containing protein (c-di-GMP phosphodiesterase class II)|nr:HD domain-containing phosphohydrolase [Gemmataceae bacterium]
MSETQAVRGKIAALRTQLEPKPVEPTVAAPRDGSQQAGASTGSTSGPQRLIPRARHILEQSRELLQRLRTLADGLGQGNADTDALHRLRYREASAMLELLPRVMQTFPNTASAQMRLCEGLEGMLGVVAEHIAKLADANAENRLERGMIRRLEELLGTIAARRPLALDAFRSVADALLAEAEDCRPLRFPSDRGEQPATRIAAHSLTTARVVARLVRGDPAMRRNRVNPVIAALLHDVGMLAIPGEILAATGPLTDDQRRAMEGHTRAGAALLTHHFARETWLIEAAAGHHERLGGMGYPAKLKDPKINTLARLIAVCDVYAALASARPWRPALDPRTALTDTLLMAEKGELDRRHAERLLLLSFYPIGSVVELVDGAVGLVVAAHTGKTDLSTPARPVVMLLTDSENRPLAIPRPLDLTQTEHRGVVRTLTPEQRRALLGKRFPELA